ncbi:SPFH domain / Band 7 family protein [Posidoniimonas polymericola]|uniref:SPFH domain / Band 7 family protein n=1 Tax=Posidoniimonas polymericola TaxID=2528002 RepID=A0A5C5YIE2_9BACT|nr:SPFH domain-containing protein [Posidoniimonas polymericola]TWT74632.1 SPFH domain / Band 7 family protein [Posidoniimonas polymericola]
MDSDYDAEPESELVIVEQAKRRGASLVRSILSRGPYAVALLVFGVLGFGWFVYTNCRINVPDRHIAVLTRKTGEDLTNDQELAPNAEHKGMQLQVLSEGRYFYNPYFWNWKVYPMVEIPRDKMGVRVRLYGDDLPYGDFIAKSENKNQKGIIDDVLKPGRYAINAMVIDRVTKQEVGGNRKGRSDYVEVIELWDPKIIPAGYKGIVTNLAGPMPDEPNTLLVEAGRRGPQQVTYEPGTYYKNPYLYRINSIDTRSQRFNLSKGKDMTFPSKDGFAISLDGIIEFRVIPETAALTYVTYNDVTNDADGASDISQEIINKVIMPNARAFCRLRGSNTSAREFIGGVTRTAFQTEFQRAITETCKSQGIEIVQALITKIKPPQAIAEPLRDREVNAQELKQYTQQILQQQQEAKLATEKALIEQKRELIGADRQVIEAVTLAKEEQQVALEAANRDKAVAEQKLEAARDEAEAIMSRSEAKAAVVGYQNEADAAGWQAAVAALGNDGEAYARYVLYQKLAPGYRNIMTNTADSPLMDVFRAFAPPTAAAVPGPSDPGPAE